MLEYTAPNPYEENTYFGSWVDFFPSNTFVGKSVLRSQNRPVPSEQYFVDLDKKSDIKLDRVFITTHDAALLDTIQIIPKNILTTKECDQYYIVKFNGNYSMFQDKVDRYIQDAISLDTTVIGFNYRNVANSRKEPTSFQDLVTDGIAQVQRLLDQGADSKKITLDGTSLGGAVATMVASYFHKKNLPVYLWNDRSFSRLSKAATGLLIPSAILDLNEKALDYCSLPTSYILKICGWEVDIAAVYNEIPAEYKGYMVIAEKSEHSTGDQTITYKASLHYAIESLETESTGNVLICHEPGGGHIAARDTLFTLDGSLNAQEIFENFILQQRSNYNNFYAISL